MIILLSAYCLLLDVVDEWLLILVTTVRILSFEVSSAAARARQLAMIVCMNDWSSV